MIIGIDPGLSGALAFLSDSGEMSVRDMPTLEWLSKGRGKRELDIAGLRYWIMMGILDPKEPVHVVLERAGSRPGEGVSSAWRNGATWGATYATLIALHYKIDVVTPQAWKKAMRVPADKDMARKRATELMPDRAHYWPLKKHDGRAEAAMLALYGRQFLS